MIQVQHLVHEYPGKRALDDVSFTVRDGSITALVGPNGAGKTTLMRCIAALEMPFSGSIHIAAIDVMEHPRRAHKELGYLSDFFGLYEDLTVAQCLLFAARLHQMEEKRAQQQIEWASSLLELTPWLKQSAGSLSRGWKQRVGIALALIHRPKLLLLDEPASGLDPEARIALSSLLRKMRDEGMTILVSSHILAELEDYCTDMLVLRQGKVIEHRMVTEGALSESHIEITVVDSPETLLAALKLHANVSEIHASPGGAQIKLAGGAQDQHQLLKELIEKGIAISGFAAKHTSLQDIYVSLTQDGKTL